MRKVISVLCILLTALTFAACTSSTTSKNTNLEPSNPVFVYPQNNQTLDLAGAYLFKVQPVANASGYLWGFFQNGTMVWENYRDEGKLSGVDYGIQPDTVAHKKFMAGSVEVWLRAYVNEKWTDATIITIKLQ